MLHVALEVGDHLMLFTIRRRSQVSLFHWWLKRRWARLAVITAIETRYAGLGYAGGSAQQQAAAFHAQAQAQGDWREDGAYRQREEETAAHFFGGFGGA